MLSGSDYPRFVGSIMKDIKYLSRKSPDLTNLTHIFFFQITKCRGAAIQSVLQLSGRLQLVMAQVFTLHPLMSAELACEFVCA